MEEIDKLHLRGTHKILLTEREEGKRGSKGRPGSERRIHQVLPATRSAIITAVDTIT